MKTIRFCAAALAIGAVLQAAPAAAQKLNLIATFNDLIGPDSSLVADKGGNLYGTTGGSPDGYDGTIFKLTRPTAVGAGFTNTTLFTFNGANGSDPLGALIVDAAGNLYGTTNLGGPNTCGNANCGIAYELTPPAAGQTAWSQTVIATFNGANGAYPEGALIADKAGNLYGATGQGGRYGGGVVFELTPPGAGQTGWASTVLYSFGGIASDGTYPNGGLLIDSTGHLFGTAHKGGQVPNCNSCGTVFELTPPASGQTAWTETVLYTFKTANNDGYRPGSGLVADRAGNLFGTTEYGGGDVASRDCVSFNGCGTVFELTPPASGQTGWTETILAAFGGFNGENPETSLIFDRAGNLYGTTLQGGPGARRPSIFGTLFKLTPPATGQTSWTQTILATLDNRLGGNPSGVIFDRGGHLYGTTAIRLEGNGDGTVFRLNP